MAYTLSEPKLFGLTRYYSKSYTRLQVIDLATNTIDQSSVNLTNRLPALVCKYDPSRTLTSLITTGGNRLSGELTNLIEVRDPDTLLPTSTYYIATSSSPYPSWIRGIQYDRVTDELLVLGHDDAVVRNMRLWRTEPLTGAIVSEVNISNVVNPTTSYDLAIDHSSGGNNIVICNITDKAVYVLDEDGVELDYIDFSGIVTPGYHYITYCAVDDAGDLSLTVGEYANWGTWTRIIFNGISNDIADVVVHPGYINLGFDIYGGGDVPTYDPVTGNPAIDAALAVVDGVWENPNGPNVHGAYVAEVSRIAKLLGYKGADLAAIIKAASQSQVNK